MQALEEMIRDTIQWFDDVMPVEQTKLKAASSGNVAKLEDIMKQEQVLILRLKGLDKNRDMLLDSMGMPGLSFKEVLERLPDEERGELTPLYREMNVKLTAYRKLSEDINTLLRNNIHTMGKMAEMKSYFDRNAEQKRERHMTSKKA